jgi:hypothetical protein
MHPIPTMEPSCVFYPHVLSLHTIERNGRAPSWSGSHQTLDVELDDASVYTRHSHERLCYARRRPPQYRVKLLPAKSAIFGIRCNVSDAIYYRRRGRDGIRPCPALTTNCSALCPSTGKHVGPWSTDILHHSSASYQAFMVNTT